MPDEWYYAKNKKQRGPVSAAELKEMADAGDLEPTDKVWKEGMPQWAPAKNVKGLFASPTARKGGKASRDDEPFDDPDDGGPRKKKRQPDRKRGGALWWILGGTGALLLFCVCGGGVALVATGGLNALRPVNVTKAFEVKTGMSQAECEALMGPGKVVSKQTVPGNQVFFLPPNVPKNKATYETKHVMWEDGRGGRAEFDFVDDKCVFGLK
jgi:hypothetical protein